MPDANDALKEGGPAKVLKLRSGAKPRPTPADDATTAPVEIERHTEGQVAQAFAERHRDRLRYCWRWKRWIAHDGTRWTD
ncbi:MAG: hypothetical protein RLZZ467_1027, partial [Gemmatimonadota bacterium]